MSVWGTGGNAPDAEAFLGTTDHRIRAVRPPSSRLRRPADLPAGRARTLDHGKPPPRPAALMRHSCADLLRGGIPTRPRRDPPKGETARTRRLAPQASVVSVRCRYGNISPFIHSTTPVGLALGPDSPGDDERGPGTLGHPAGGIRTRLSLLMSAFSLPNGPRQACAAASPRWGRSPTQHPNGRCRVFGGVLEPRYIVGAEPLDQ